MIGGEGRSTGGLEGNGATGPGTEEVWRKKKMLARGTGRDDKGLRGKKNQGTRELECEEGDFCLKQTSSS